MSTKLYFNCVDVRSYQLCAVGETPQKCIEALVKSYRKHFGSFRSNGFKNSTEWLKYHGIGEYNCDEITVNCGWLI